MEFYKIVLSMKMNRQESERWAGYLPRHVARMHPNGVDNIHTDTHIKGKF
jgi:hypothetical protein